MKNIYLIRHGQSQANAGMQAQANADIPLTDLGHQQAQQVADWLRQRTEEHITGIYVSKYLRTQQTAQPLVNQTKLSPIILDALHEFNYLALETVISLTYNARMTLAEQYWQTAAPESISGDGIDASVESFSAFCRRIPRVLAQLRELPDGNHMVYSHGLWMSMLIWQVLSQPTDSGTAMREFRRFQQGLNIKNGEVFLLRLDDGNLPAMTKVRTAPK